MKPDQHIVVVVLVFFFGWFVGAVAEESVSAEHLTRFLGPLATLFAAFFGAWFAFLLSKSEKSKELESKQVAAINRAQFVIGQMVNNLMILQRDHIDPYRLRSDYWFAMPALPTRQFGDLKLNQESLEFLLDGVHKQILLELMIEEQRFHEAINALNMRSYLHYEGVQPRLAAGGIQEGVAYEFADIGSVLGQELVGKLKNLTDQVIYHSDTTIASLEEMQERLARAAKELFPHRSFIKAVRLS